MSGRLVSETSGLVCRIYSNSVKWPENHLIHSKNSSELCQEQKHDFLQLNSFVWL